MWPEQQPPGGEQNPQDPQHAQVPPHNPYQQPGYQQPNPYQQPGYQQTGYPQPNAHPQPPQQHPGWGAPTPTGAPQPPPGGGGDGNRTKITAIVAAAAVVLTAGVTGFLVLGGDKDKEAGSDSKDKPSSQSAPASTPASASADPSDAASASAPTSDDNPRNSEAEKPTVAGWKVVVNPKWGTAFDVPADWEVETPGTISGFEETDAKGETKPIITMSAPAYYKSKWCVSDDDKDGRTSDTALAAVGTKGASGAKNTDEVAVNQVPWWVYGGYTQPDRKSLVFDEKATPYTTKSGIKGSFARAHSKNTPQRGKCTSDGKAITFGFKNSVGDYVAWSLYGAAGVPAEVSEKTVMQILSTVRLHGDPTGG